MNQETNQTDGKKKSVLVKVVVVILAALAGYYIVTSMLSGFEKAVNEVEVPKSK